MGGGGDGADMTLVSSVGDVMLPTGSPTDALRVVVFQLLIELRAAMPSASEEVRMRTSTRSEADVTFSMTSDASTLSSCEASC